MRVSAVAASGPQGADEAPSTGHLDSRIAFAYRYFFERSSILYRITRILKRYLQIRSSGGVVRIFQIDNLHRSHDIHRERNTIMLCDRYKTLMRAFISLWRIVRCARGLRNQLKAPMRGQDTMGARRMPWHRKSKKDAASCDKPRGGADSL